MTENKNPKPNSPPPKIFYTDINENSEIEHQQNRLKKYVDDLNSKIDYAKWKQSLVLQYNYLPLKRISQKVEHEKVTYLKKIAQEEKHCAKILSGKQITVQLDLFRDFSKKLNEKLQEYQVKIAEEKIRNNMLKQEVEEKKIRLKGRMKQNMEVIRSTLQQEGIRNKEDIVTLVRSRSMRDRITPTSMTFDSHRNYSERKPVRRKLSSQSKREQPSLNDQLFRECLDKLVATVQSMKSSEDIQSGIYLDIMDRGEKSSYSTEGRYGSGGKSKISQTIHNRFGSTHIQQVRSSKDKASFDMDWQTFKQLNWKQIMGIVLVKDKHCLKTKQLLRYK